MNKRYKATENQKGLWYMQQYAPNIALYNTPLMLKIKSDVDVKAIKKTFEMIADRHEALRTVFIFDSEELYQDIDTEFHLDFEIISLSNNNAKEINLNIKQHCNKPFDLSRQVFKVRLFKINKYEYILLICWHHIAEDMLSVNILLNEFVEIYSSSQQGIEPKLNKIENSFLDYSKWEENYLQSDKGSEDRLFWERECKAIDPMDFLGDKKLNIKIASSNIKSVEIDDVKTQSILNQCKQFEVSPHQYFTASLLILLGRYCLTSSVTLYGQSDVRPSFSYYNTIGYFTNRFAFNMDIDKSNTFCEFLSSVNNNFYDVLKRKSYPFSLLGRELEELKGLIVGLDWHDESISELVEGLSNKFIKLECYGVSEGIIGDDLRCVDYSDDHLSVTAIKIKNRLKLSFHYRTDTFSDQFIDSFIKHYINILTQLTTQSIIKLSDIQLVTHSERKKILVDWNDTTAPYPKGKTIYQLFEGQVNKTPDNIAVTFEGKQLSYSELNNKSNRCANHLISLGVVRESRVLLLVDRSINYLVGMLGVWKAGGAFTPLNPDFPDAKNIDITSQVSAIVLLSDKKHLTQGKRLCDKEHVISFDAIYKADVSEENPNIKTSSDDLAYIIFTSGSTGKPKGVMVQHKGMVNHVYAKINDFDIDEQDVVAQTATQTFDVHVWQFMVSLLVGGKAAVLGGEDAWSPDKLLENIEKHKISVFESVPAHFSLILDHIEENPGKYALKSLRYMMMNGEGLPPAYCQRWFIAYPDIPMANVYGPTECSDDITHFKFNEVSDSWRHYVPIGKPVQNMKLYVLDKDLSPVPEGVPGELYASGDGVGLGYLDLPDKTQEAFINNPFANEEDKNLDVNTQLYKTGDLVRWLPGGILEYLSRTDFQVKIRGQRVELGEIESAIISFDNIKQAAVEVLTTKAQGKDIKYLVAYYVTASGKKDPEIEGIRSYLSETLPDYMLPAAFVKLDEMPLTPNGKINRRALPEHDMSLMGEEYVAPINEIEKKLAAIWSDILKVDQDKVGIHDNFFHLGGHSLLAIQLVARMHAKLNCDISIKNLFDKPKLMDLSLFIEHQIKQGAGLEYSPIKKTRLLKDGNAMSFAQERLWFLDQFEGSNENYNMPMVVRLDGNLNIKAMESSLNQLIARQASFRTVFTKDKTGVGVQKVLDKLELNLVAEKLDNQAKGKALEKSIKADIKKEISTPFDFVKGPLIRVRLFEVKGDEHVLVFNHHHIISDGVSVDIILKELSEFYLANIEKREPILAKLPIQYVDFAAWQRAEFKKPDFQEKLKYWKDTLAGYSDLQLPADKSRPKTFSYKGADFNFILDKDLSEKLSKLAQDNGTTLYMVLLTAFNVLLSRYSGQDDIILGSPIANRYHHDVEGLVGLFVNTLILRNRVDSNQSVKELLNQISQDTLSAFDNQEVPFEKIVELLDVTRDAGRNPIVQVMFSLQYFGGDESGESALKLPALDIHPYQNTSNDIAKFDLSLFMSDGGDELAGSFNYCPDLFDQETIESISRNFEILLSAIVENSSVKIKDLRLLTDARRKQILVDWNNTAAPYPKDKTIHQLFEEQVSQAPNNVAVVFEDYKLSYKDLNKQSNQLARLIINKYKAQNKINLKPDSLIGLCVERSFDMIIGILAILKAGAAYVPLDPDYPQDRLEYMIKDSHEVLIITQKNVVARVGVLDKLHHDELLVIDCDDVKADLLKQNDSNLDKVCGPNNLAYVIYTSGSTGRPKGVMINHRGPINTIFAVNRKYKIGEKDKVLARSNFSFDLSIYDVFGLLFAGGSIVLLKRSQTMNPTFWFNLMQKYKITVWNTVPQLVNILADHVKSIESDLKLLKLVLISGDWIPKSLPKEIKKISDSASIVSLGGATEASIWSVWYDIEYVNDSWKSIPYGKPMPNQTMYILDKYCKPCPIGAPGEIYIGGDGVALGYLNLDERTTTNFINHKELGYIYRTGDLGRWLASGNIEFIGRTDFQVKIRGFRIELGEIENVLSKHKDISQVSVVDKENEGQKYLVAYYVVAKDKESPEIDDLRDHLSETLPDYMVPTAFVKLDEMPLTPNGKINRRALPDPDMSLMGEEYVAPRNEIEEKLAEIWSDILKTDKDNIGIYDNFFHLGGQSLLAIQLVARIHAKLNCDISIKNLFDKPKLMDFALFIENKIKAGAGAAYSPIKKTKLLIDGNPMSFAQERLWFLDQFERLNKNYNIPMVVRLVGNLNIKAMESSLNQLIARQASFRTIFPKDKTGVGVQKILDQLELDVLPEKIDAKVKGKDLEKAIKYEINKEISKPFDLVKGPMVRVRLFEVKGDEHVLVFNHHHIISDGVSVDIILKELSEFYLANIEKRESKLDKLPIQYVDFAAWQRAEFEKPEFQEKLKYWKDALCDYNDLQLPIDKSRPTTFSYKGADFGFSLDKDLSVKLTKLAQDNGTTLYMVLLTAFNVLLSRYSGSEDIVLGSPITNRYHHDIEGLVGFFVNTLVLRNQVDSNKSIKELLNQISSDTLTAFDHQEVPFEQIVELLDVTRDTSRNPIVQVLFSLQSFGGDARGEYALKLPGVDITPYSDASYDVAKFDLSLFMSQVGEKLAGSFNYCTDLFDQETIERISRNFNRLLSAMVENCSAKIKDLRLLTDERRKQILIDWNDTAVPYPKDKTIHQLFEEQVDKTPDNIAVVFGDGTLSYKDLNKKSNQLARLIRTKYKAQNKKDLKPDSLIGLCVERSLDMIIGILAILKAGGAYVPLDPDYPQDRLEYMIEDSHEGLIITQKDIVEKGGFLDKLHHDELLLIDSDEVKADLSKQSTENFEKVSGSDNLAYVIYTSGSAGRPKGVMVPHKGVINLMSDLAGVLGMDAKSRFLSLTSISFDIFVLEYTLPLFNGSTCIVVSESSKLDFGRLKDLFNKHQPNFVQATPSMWDLMSDYLPKMKQGLKLLTGGENLPNSLKDKLFNIVDYVYNVYGPTETTIWSTYTKCQKDKKVTIGKPFANTQIYILDNNLNPCPIGAPGELYIGGAGLARGYLNQEELTKERFISNPFAKELCLLESDRIYKTGDLVRWLPDGNIEYLGRTDSQVKIRGFRIELGEIENVFAKHDSISQVIVIEKEKEGQKYLAAYYVVAKDSKEPVIDDLRSYLSETLHDYMVPAAFVKLDEMPLTPNGKINRRALPDPDMSLMGEEYVAPRNEVEQKLSDIWCEVLKLEQIGIHDNFFSMGGDSIIIIQLVSRARNSDIYFTPKDLFQNPTIAQLAVIDLKGSVIEADQGLVIGDAPLIPIQQWFFEQNYENQDHWNQAQLLQVSESLDLVILERAVSAVIHHHDGLRLRYKEEIAALRSQRQDYKQYYESTKSALNLKINKIDLGKIKPQEKANKLTEHCSKIQGSLNIESGPVMAVALFTGLNDGKDRLLIAIHHLMVDGISWRVITPDLQSCYQQIKEGKDVKLSPKTSSYQDWGNALIEYADNKAIDDLDYWVKISEDIKPLKHDFDLKQDYENKMDGVHISWDKKHTDALLNKTQQAYNTEINDLLLSAFALALANWQKIDSVSFNLEGHGREDCVSGVDITRTVGWFASLFPVVLDLPEIKDINNLTDLDYKACIQSIKEQLRAIPDKGLSYGALKYLASSSSKDQLDAISSLHISKASFNYLGQFGGDDKTQDKNSWGFAAESSGFAHDPKNHHPNLLDLNGMVMDGKLGFSIAFSTDHFSKESMDKFSKLFKSHLTKIVEHCVCKYIYKSVTAKGEDTKDIDEDNYDTGEI